MAKRYSKYDPPEVRFWGQVEITESGCWEWTGCKHKGYGRLRVDNKGVFAHRYSWEIHNGEIPPGMLICHKCDNPCCVRPDHLFVGTYKDNSQDAVKKKRTALGDRNASRLYPERRPRGDKHHWQTKPETRMYGEKNGRAKLTEEDVKKVWELWLSGEHTKRGIGRMFGVSDVAIYQIVKGINWPHLFEKYSKGDSDGEAIQEGD